MMTTGTSTKLLDLSFLPDTPLYQGDTASVDWIGWQLSPKPFVLSHDCFHRLQTFGMVLHQFVKATDLLYKQSKNSNTDIPAWVAELYQQGKPESLIKFSELNRLKSQLPLVIRPDLLLQENGWSLCEIDAVPGGLGFTGALSHLYKKNGFPVIEASEGLPAAFLSMLKALTPDKAMPVIAVILSDEAADYRAEMEWLVHHIRLGSDQAEPYPNIALVHPSQIALDHSRLVFYDEHSQSDRPIDTIYRFFELFDLPNIPNIELIQFAIKKNWVKCTPPFKPHVEEKLSLALLHHPQLSAFWSKAMGQTAYETLKSCVPQGWILDPAPVPPHAVIPNLQPGGMMIQNFEDLKSLSQKQRRLVVKASGFSPVGWGSKSVTIGHDQSAEVWAGRLDEALSSFGMTPYLLQQFEPASVFPVERLNTTDQSVTVFNARVRLCPYYLITQETVQLTGVLATACPADKKIIHGMKDAVMVPCMVEKTEVWD